VLTFNNELFCGLLIGLLLGFLIHHKTYQNQFHTINQKIDQIINKIEPRRKQFKNKTNQLTSDKQYSQEIENLWKDFKQLFDKKTKLNPNFSFSKMAIEIRELLEGKGVATDLDGMYSIELDSGSYTLKVSYVGYKPEEKKIRVKNKFHIIVYL